MSNRFTWNAILTKTIVFCRDSARAILESDQWLEALKTDVDPILDLNSPRETPMRLIIKLFPGLAKLVFDRCIETNLQTETKQASMWKEDCVTADNEKFELIFNFELLDDTYVMKNEDEYDYDGDLWQYDDFGRVHPKAVTYTWSKTDLKRNHPLMIMVSDNRMVMLN